jgi:hypothetical protein
MSAAADGIRLRPRTDPADFASAGFFLLRAFYVAWCRLTFPAGISRGREVVGHGDRNESNLCSTAGNGERPVLRQPYPRKRFSNLKGLVQSMAIGFQFEVLDSSELAQRLKVRESWVIDQSKRSRTSDPIPVFRLGKHRRYRWGSPEMNDWLDRRVDDTTTRKAGSK